jgi:hypothetical protein
MPDPFTLVFNRLWEIVEAHPDAASVIKPGNRIKLNEQTKREPTKPFVQVADLPELMLVTEGGNLNLHSTSSSTKIVRRYSWLLSTGDARVNYLLYPVEWLLVEAFSKWTTELTSLTYKDKHFVKRFDILDVSEGWKRADENRNIKGWSAIWKCEIEMHFATNDLKRL